MLSKRIEKALNDEIDLENGSSNFDLTMASCAATLGISGLDTSLYPNSNEEYELMFKRIGYINERSGKAENSACKEPPKTFDSVQTIFRELAEHEIKVSEEINGALNSCLNDKYYTKHNFTQWPVYEQNDGEALAHGILDKLNLIGKDKAGFYLFDRDFGSLSGNQIA